MQIENLQHQNSKYRYVKIREKNARLSTIDTFLYIGTDEEVYTELTSGFKKSYKSSSFPESIEVLGSLLHQGGIPQFIFIDLAFNEIELNALKNFISADPAFAYSYIFYNIRKLNIAERNLVISKKLVDDMVDFKTEMALVSDKVKFLKKIKTESANRDQGIKIETREADISETSNALKRAIDIVIAGILVVALIPVFLIIALAIKLESRGPVFYNSYRAGRGYNIFRFYKFRTMKVGADRMINSMLHLNKYNTSLGPVFFKIQNDPRITRVGAFLRSTGLDELPQLINVLKGEMSIVGNRPLPLYEASTLTTDEWAERFMAPAGITGLWQIMNRKNAVVSVEERLSIDIEYARKNNFLMDFSIMLNTPGVIIKELPIPENKFTNVNGKVKLQPEFSQL